MPPLRNSLLPLLILLLLIPPSSGCSGIHPREHDPAESETSRTTIAAQVRKALHDELSLWYPLCLDTTYGGYFSDIDSRWKLDGDQTKMIVTQARHVWSTANGAMFYQKDTLLRSVAAHGVRFLTNTMWDHEYGGFYNLVTRTGTPVKEDGQIVKRAYGNAFAIYGLAAYYKTSGDTSALRLAQATFRWLEQHSYDSLYGGYFQFLSREGTPMRGGYEDTPPKDQNSTIHLLEAFTELYHVWPDPALRVRLQSLLVLVRDTITADQGFMRLFFQRDWTPVSYRDSSPAEQTRNYDLDHVSFGHDVETAYLMLEASEELGFRSDTLTLTVAKRMVDHALTNGWDSNTGGIFDGGYYFRGDQRATIVKKTKEWWAQAEALNSLLLMSELFPADPLDYYGKFCAQWDYCRKYLIDDVNGGWYWGGLDIVPALRTGPKGSIWKGNYHTSRALINCVRRLADRPKSYGQARIDPVNPDATPEARALLSYLYSVGGKRIVAGHHTYVQRPDTFINRVYELTGKKPAVWGCDFINYAKKGEAARIVQEAYTKYRDGYIVTLMWHAGRPQDDPPFGWKESIQGKLTDKEWEALMQPGTALHSRWLIQVDTVAQYLKALQTLGVPVLWRPYHELNGVWFWWGNRKGDRGSAKLYRMMFDRFVGYHKLHNLLWVWNTNTPRQLIQDEAFAYEDFFPGTDCVDVLAADVYHRDYRQSHHDELFGLGGGKLIALGEIGQVPAPEILVRQPLWAWFMIWADWVNTHNSPKEIQDLYGSPRVLTHTEYSATR